MNKIKSKIDTEKVIQTINENLAAIKKKFQPEKLSKEGQERILEQLEDLENLALKVRNQIS